ncbi:Nif3-like dinuclear metal center hexameric protein [Paludibacterium yongneupense]|uniref:Nif3-like dinuclear metal center hexameric protein n=1 Tax=Paludibacterium yongneupense TaxID=400061 RepID=UPI00041690F4|nr:Nif3-like dinuclear metal center hexameric protein [Paludibacterium yongneupense]
MLLTELVARLDALLEPSRFRDYAPNGLQVEGRAEVKHILVGVSAAQSLLDAAVEQGADAVLVHHGYFWKNEDPCVTGIKKKRLQALLANNISLLAYHLPLDAHPLLGNNARLAAELDLAVDGQGGEQGLLWHGRLAAPMTAADWSARVGARLRRPPVLLGRPDKRIERVAWCSGGAQAYFADAIALGVDAFLTGEASEQNHHMAIESDIAFLAAGHHATERYGIQALGQLLRDDYDMTVCWQDNDNPI